MMAGFLTPKQTTEEIVASVLDDIICDVERKAKNRARKQRQKAKKKRDKFMSVKNDDEFRFYYGKNCPVDSVRGKAMEIAKRTEDELKPLGYKFVDYYDTVIWDECEKPLHACMLRQSNGMSMSKISSELMRQSCERFVYHTDRMPKDIIMYCDPSSHSYTMALLSNVFSPEIAFSSNYIFWIHRAEDFYYSRIYDTPQSFYNSQIKRCIDSMNQNISQRLEDKQVECPICMETKTLCVNGESEIAISSCCGGGVCMSCLNQFLMSKSEFAIVSENGRKKINYSEPEYTCPLCRGGFFYPDEPKRISDEVLEKWSMAMRVFNGENPEEIKKEKEENVSNHINDFMLRVADTFM